MRVRDPYEAGIFTRALFGAALTPIAEVTVVRHIYGVRHEAGYAVERFNVAVDGRLTLLQTNGIRVKRIGH